MTRLRMARQLRAGLDTSNRDQTATQPEGRETRRERRGWGPTSLGAWIIWETRPISAPSSDLPARTSEGVTRPCRRTRLQRPAEMGGDGNETREGGSAWKTRSSLVRVPVLSKQHVSTCSWEGGGR